MQDKVYILKYTEMKTYTLYLGIKLYTGIELCTGTASWLQVDVTTGKYCTSVRQKQKKTKKYYRNTKLKPNCILLTWFNLKVKS